MIFCQQCTTLLLVEPVCKQCGWSRPRAHTTPGSILWQKTLPTPPALTSQLAISGQVVLIPGGDDPTTLYALHLQNGGLLWEYPLPPRRVVRQPVAVGSQFVITSEDSNALGSATSHLIALDALTGRETWRSAITAHSHSAPVVTDGMIFLTTNNRQGFAIDSQSGKLVWRIDDLPTWTSTQPAWGDGEFFVGARGPLLTAVRAYDGAARTLFQTQSEAGWFEKSPAYADGVVYATCWDQKVYAIDAASGQLCWHVPGGRGITTHPAVGPYVYVGVKDFVDGQKGYALHAYQRENGRMAWRFVTERHIQVPPVVQDGLVFVGCDDQHLYALDSLTGQEAWRVALGDKVRTPVVIDGDRLVVVDRRGRVSCILRQEAKPEEPLLAAATYRQRGEWEKAGIAAALSGDCQGAAEDYIRLGRYDEAAQLYAKAQAWSEAGQTYEEIKKWPQALKMYRQGKDRVKEAGVLWQMKEYIAAAELYEEAGMLNEAAQGFERAGALGRLAILLPQIGQWQRAVEVYLKLKEPQAAAAVYESVRQFDSAIQLLHQHHYYQEAALCCERATRWVQAAQYWEQLARWPKAVGAYQKAGEIEKAAQLLQRNNQTEEAVRLLEGSGRYGSAAAIRERLGQLSEAAHLYRQGNEKQKAIRLYEQIKDWNQVKDLAYELNEHEREAKACEQLAESSRGVKRLEWRMAAAQAYERAALDHQQRSKDDDQAIRLWEAAARYYESGGGDKERIENCQEQIRRLRQWPWLRLKIMPDQELVETEGSNLHISVINVGYSAARNVAFKVQGADFGGAINQTQYLFNLPEGIQKETQLFVRPRPGTSGHGIPLDITVFYETPDDQKEEQKFRQTVTVVRQDSKQLTPHNIVAQPGAHVYVAQEGIHVAHGDLIQSDGQKGDRVEIQRQASSRSQVSPAISSTTVDPSEPVDDSRVIPPIPCPRCRKEVPASSNYCTQCRFPMKTYRNF